ncbi:MAG: hypothetical protein JWM99_807 [Verrucomicrobiales bacterium]|nr:hypothetical protein [Verrucomicrobiales bacterium]
MSSSTEPGRLELQIYELLRETGRDSRKNSLDCRIAPEQRGQKWTGRNSACWQRLHLPRPRREFDYVKVTCFRPIKVIRVRFETAEEVP